MCLIAGACRHHEVVPIYVLLLIAIDPLSMHTVSDEFEVLDDCDAVIYPTLFIDTTKWQSLGVQVPQNQLIIS